ncbi:DUF523 domain-containing protein [Mailhella sp.]|uniref:DUF523 domain-containing protein n=1 Tax=Mailhella sp. TaxID=1981029 RepID=UPI003AB3DB36
MTDLPKPCRYVVSACLAGTPCRYDGRSNLRPEIAELVRRGEAVPVCPEVLGGLPTPRTPSEQKNGRVVAATGEDVTDAFVSGAEAALYIAEEYGCCAAVLKARSPSCGCGRVYDGTFTHTLVDGDGLFAALLRKKGFQLFTEETFDAEQV